MDQELGTKVGLGPGHIVLDGNPAPPKVEKSPPQFSALVYCGETVAHLSYCCATMLVLCPCTNKCIKFVSDIAVFVLKRDVKPTGQTHRVVIGEDVTERCQWPVFWEWTSVGVDCWKPS